MANSFRASELRDIDPTEILNYAEAQGWTRKPMKQANFMLLQHPTKKLRQFILPTLVSKDKNLNLIGDALEELAKDDTRSPLQLATDLLFPADVLRIHATNKEIVSGTGPFLAGVQLLQTIQGMLETTADVIYRQNDPLAFSYTPTQLLETCRIGPADMGRFGNTVFIPIPTLPQNGHTSEEVLQSVDFGRRTTLAFMKGITELRRFLNEGTLETGTPTSVLTARLGELLGILDFGHRDTQIDISMSWSVNRPKVESSIPALVSFRQLEFPYLKGLALSIRGQTTSQRVRLVGQVIEVRAATSNPLIPTQGSIRVQTLFGDEKAEIEVFLKGEEYRKACDAHRDRIPVSVTGVIEKKNAANLYELRDTKEIQVLSTELPV